MVPTIQIKNATLTYEKTILFSHLHLELRAYKWTALLGPSGVGKSSLLRMLAHLLTPKEIYSANIEADNHQPIQQQISYMAQTDSLLPWLTVMENATLKLKLRAYSPRDYRLGKQQALSLLEKVGLDHVLSLYPYQLSGGMRQRVALVRTLMEDKPVVLMDEPFSALDAITRYKLQSLATELLNEKTVLFVTHDPTEALRLANEIYIMQGRPATLKHIATLTAEKPRELTEPSMLALQTSLFHELTEAAELT